MKFTEMNFFEAEALNTTKKFNRDKINVPLSEIVKVSETGEVLPNDSKLSDKALEKLADELITDTESFEHAYNHGNLESILTKGVIATIHRSIENSISSLPGINPKVYEFLKSRGIKTISQFKQEHVTSHLNKDELAKYGIKDDDIEDVQILVERKEKPSLLRVYHSSVDINCADYIFNREWADGPNSQAYGTGLYTVWTKNSAFNDTDVYGRRSWCPKDFYRDHAIESGKEFRVNLDNNEKINFRFEFLVDAKDYFIGNWELFDQTHPDARFPDGTSVNKSNFIRYQNQKFGTHVDESGSPHAVQSYFWSFWWKNNGANGAWKNGNPNPHFVSESKDGKITENGPCVKGIAFVGQNDGDVVVVYDTKRALPIRVSKGGIDEWFYIGGPGTLTKAENLLSMGISASTSEFWKQIESAYRKTLDEIWDTHQGSWDMNETEFLSSDGKNVIISDSLEEDIIEGPEAQESNNNGIFENYKVENCLNAKSYHIPLRMVNNLEIVNDVDADVELITSLSSDSELIVNDTLRMYNCPKAVLPWRVFYNKDFTGKAKIQNMKLLPGTMIQGFDQVILGKVNLDSSIGFIDSGAASDKGKISLVDVSAKHLYICLDKMDEVKRLNITGDSNIENLHIVTRRPGKSIGKITLSRQCAESNMQIHFEIQTDKHRSIYKDDDEVIKTTYSVQDLIDILQEDTDESSEIFETLQFRINGKGIDII
jgi:hypothetical protein